MFRTASPTIPYISQLLIYYHYKYTSIIPPKILRVSTEPVVSHALPVPEDSTQPAPFCLAQRTLHVHAATCRGKQHMCRPGRTSLVAKCWKKLASYRFSPRARNTLGKVWLIPAGGATRLDPTSL